jgi:hypothetical protein
MMDLRALGNLMERLLAFNPAECSQKADDMTLNHATLFQVPCHVFRRRLDERHAASPHIGE